MSDTEKKKGGKLPIIAALVLVLGAGGYFGMKGGGGSAAAEEEPEIKLGESAPIGEFLVNLSDGRSYLRAAVALQFDDQTDTHKLDHDMPVIQDAILMVLSSKSLEEVRTLDGKKKLKWEIASRVNHSLHAAHAAHDGKKKKKKKDEDAETAGHGEQKIVAPENEEGWDADEGPVLKVYFTSFVTQ